MNNLYEDITKHLLEDEIPSIYLNSIIEKINNSELKELAALKDTPQEPKYHPEGSVWNHLMLVVDEGAKVRDRANNKKVFMWALLLHDIGKASTTKKRKGKWTSYNHDSVGAKIAYNILENYDESEDFKVQVSNLVKHHMNHIYMIKDLPFGNVKKMIEEVDINDMLLVFYCDSMGRGNTSESDVKERQKNIEKIKTILKDKFSLKLPVND